MHRHIRPSDALEFEDRVPICDHGARELIVRSVQHGLFGFEYILVVKEYKGILRITILTIPILVYVYRDSKGILPITIPTP